MKIPVVFAIDNNYVKQLATVVVSILKNSDSKNAFEFNILSSYISDENKQKLCSLSSFNKNITFNFIDMKECISHLDLEKYMSRRDDYKYISIETYFRFFIPDLFPQYNKVLYLDADILVMQDIKQLFDTDISSFYAGVIQDTVLEVFIDREDIKTNTEPKRTYKEYFKEKLKKENQIYFNAGVLLLNLDKIRRDNVVEKLWKFAQEESPLEYQDQDILNAVLEQNIKFVDDKWNVLKDLCWFATQAKEKSRKQQLFSVYKKPGIFHYVGANKPWDSSHNEYNYPFIKEWWKYYKMTPYYKNEESEILKRISNIQNDAKYKNYRSLILFRILNFSLLDIFIEQYALRIVLFNFIKTRIKLKKTRLENGILKI